MKARKHTANAEIWWLALHRRFNVLNINLLSPRASLPANISTCTVLLQRQKGTGKNNHKLLEIAGLTQGFYSWITSKENLPKQQMKWDCRDKAICHLTPDSSLVLGHLVTLWHCTAHLSSASQNPETDQSGVQQKVQGTNTGHWLGSPFHQCWSKSVPLYHVPDSSHRPCHAAFSPPPEHQVLLLAHFQQSVVFTDAN